jgi:hypothetical protein
MTCENAEVTPPGQICKVLRQKKKLAYIIIFLYNDVSKFLFLMQNFTDLTRRAAGCYLRTPPNSRKPAEVEFVRYH